VTKPRMRQKQGRAAVQYSAAVSQLGFGSVIARDAFNDGVSCDGVARPELIDSGTVRSPVSVFFACKVLSF